ncbi:hypothetical protein ACA910_012939 [Epithemia clementina (nom. ined.)]
MDGKDHGSMGPAPWMYQQSYAGQQGSSDRGTPPQPHHFYQHGFSSQSRGAAEGNPLGQPMPSSPVHYHSHDYSGHTSRDHEQASGAHDQAYDPNDASGAHPYSQHQPQQAQHLPPPQHHDSGANMYYMPNQFRPPGFDYQNTQHQPLHQHQQHLYRQNGPSPPVAYAPPPPAQHAQHSAIGSSLGHPMHHVDPFYAQMNPQGPGGRQPIDPQWAHHQYQSMPYPTNSPYMQQYHQGYPSHPGTHHHTSAALPFGQNQYPPHYFQSASAGFGHPTAAYPHAAVGPSSGELVASVSQSAGMKEPAKKKPKQRKFQRKVGKPKRPLSAYNLFFKDERAKMLAENGATGEDGAESEPAGSEDDKKPAGTASDKKKKKSGIGFAEMAQVISGQWKKIDEETLTKYKDKAAIDMRRYREEMDEFNLKQQQQQQQKDEEKQDNTELDRQEEENEEHEEEEQEEEEQDE